MLRILLITVAFLSQDLIAKEQGKSGLNLEFRVRVDARNRGMEVEKAGQTTKTDHLGIELQSIEFLANGKVTPRTSLKVSLKGEKATSKNNTPLKGDDTQFKYGYVTHKLTDSFSLGFGRIIVRRGGWSAVPKFKEIRFAAIESELPSKFQTGIQGIAQHGSHGVEVQILNSNGNSELVNSEQNSKDLSYQLRYKGKFGPIMPLLSYGLTNYTPEDGSILKGEEHSLTNMTVGLKYQGDSLSATLDYISTADTKFDRVVVGDDGTEALETTPEDSAVGVVMTATYQWGDLAPYLKYSTTKKEIKSETSYENTDMIVGISYLADKDANVRYALNLINSVREEHQGDEVIKTTINDALISFSAKL